MPEIGSPVECSPPRDRRRATNLDSEDFRLAGLFEEEVAAGIHGPLVICRPRPAGNDDDGDVVGAKVSTQTANQIDGVFGWSLQHQVGNDDVRLGCHSTVNGVRRIANADRVPDPA